MHVHVHAVQGWQIDGLCVSPLCSQSMHICEICLRMLDACIIICTSHLQVYNTCMFITGAEKMNRSSPG